MIASHRVLGLILCFFWAASMDAKNKLPAWLEAAADQPIASDWSATVLEDYGKFEFEPRGSRTFSHRYAVYMNTKDSCWHAEASVYVGTSKRNLKSFDAWLIFPSGKIEHFEKRDLHLVNLASRDELMREDYSMVLDLQSSARPGSIFAMEYERETESQFAHFPWNFRDTTPVKRSRVELIIPEDWSYTAYYQNLTEAIQGGNEANPYWEVTDLPGYDTEDFQPSFDPRKQMVFVQVIPSEKDMKRHPYQIFRDWREASDYLYLKQIGSLEAPSPQLLAKAAEILEGKVNVQIGMAVARPAEFIIIEFNQTLSN